MAEVRKVFFEDGSPYPSFITTKGTRRPYVVNGRVAWFTDGEIKEKREEAAELQKQETSVRAKKYEGGFNPLKWFRRCTA